MGTYILNKYQATKLKLDPKKYNVLIRVTSPGVDFFPLENREIYNDILELKFYDFIEERVGLTIFTDYHLETIVIFFEKHKYCENMVIHCDEGMSRSAGIAVGWFLFNDNLSSIHSIYHDKKHIPNRLIVEKFHKKFNRSMKIIEKWEKDRIKSEDISQVEEITPIEDILDDD